MPNIEISIIIATYNAAVTLRNCLNSIINQLTDEVEILIIDGNSNDDTQKIINEYKQYISYFVSEPDKGIYDAWNKGLLKVKGKYVMFIGSDDKLNNNSLAVYLTYLKNHQDMFYDLISSKRQMFDIKGNKVRVVGSIWSWPKCKKSMPISHPGALHSVNIFKKYGVYNINYKIAGDYELLLRCKDGIKTSFIDFISIEVSEGGISDSFNAIKEHYKAVLSICPNDKYYILISDTIITMKFFTKKIFRKFGINIHL